MEHERANVHHSYVRNIIFDYTESLAEREAARKHFAALVNERLTDGSMTLRLAGILYDGLAYGNWPWTLKGQKP